MKSAPPGQNAAAHATPRSKPVRTRPILQMEVTECGAASLAMILSHYGRDEPLSELRAACGVSRDGSTARNITAAARIYGLRASGHRRTDIERLRSTTAPFIAYWDDDHFLVVEGFKRDRVYLDDPARGRLRVSVDEFNLHYSGLILLLEPGPDFVKRRVRGAVMRALARRMAGVRTALGLILLCGLSLAALSIATALLIQLFVNEVLVEDLTDWVTTLAALAVGVLVLEVVGTWLQQSLLLRLAAKLALKMSAGFVWHLLRLPTAFFEARRAGGLVSRVDVNTSIAALLSGPAATASVQLVSAVVVFVVMFFYSVPLTLVASLIALANVAVLAKVSRARTEAAQQVLAESFRLSAAAFGVFGQVETVKASGTEHHAFVRLTGPQARLVTSNQRHGRTATMAGLWPGFLSTLNTTAILGLGALMVINGEMTIGAVVAFQSLVGRLLAPLATLISLGGLLQDARADVAQLDDVLDSPTDPMLALPESPAQQPGRRPAGRLELSDVTFGFARADEPLIKDLSITLEPGARVALVGATGSGKSTVGKLACGLLQPWSGEVLLDGVTLPSWPRPLLTSSLAYVNQTHFLFEGTIRENLSFWDTTIPDEALRRAAADAQVDTVIERLPAAYEAKVAGGGANFSGGQRQRLQVARALTTEPAVIILDEATNALDTTTEYELDQALRRRGLTCLIIAHRLSTIRDCDEILVLDRGLVVERGTHSELVAKGRHYLRLVDE